MENNNGKTQNRKSFIISKMHFKEYIQYHRVCVQAVLFFVQSAGHSVCQCKAVSLSGCRTDKCFRHTPADPDLSPPSECYVSWSNLSAGSNRCRSNSGSICHEAQTEGSERSQICSESCYFSNIWTANLYVCMRWTVWFWFILLFQSG